jgi:hypothetical protein
MTKFFCKKEEAGESQAGRQAGRKEERKMTGGGRVMPGGVKRSKSQRSSGLRFTPLARTWSTVAAPAKVRTYSSGISLHSWYLKLCAGMEGGGKRRKANKKKPSHGARGNEFTKAYCCAQEQNSLWSSQSMEGKQSRQLFCSTLPD